MSPIIYSLILFKSIVNKILSKILMKSSISPWGGLYTLPIKVRQHPSGSVSHNSRFLAIYNLVLIIYTFFSNI